MKEEHKNGTGILETIDVIILPAWNNIDLVPIKQLHEAKLKALRYIELMDRFIRYKL